MKTTTRIAKNKKLILGLATIILLAIVALALSMPRVATSASASNLDNPYQPNTAHVTRYHIDIDGRLAFTDNLDKFIENINYNTPIEVLFELLDCAAAPINPADSLPMTATTAEINRVMAQHTENLRIFHTARNYTAH